MDTAESTERGRSFDRSLTASIRRLAPAGIEVACRRITEADISSLRPDELALVERARPKRRAEFATGRSLLRTMLDITTAIPVGPNGAPELPAGARGSLAHDHEWAVAATTRRKDVAALGIDIEPDTVLTRAEQDIIVSPADDVDDPLLTFVQKEAVYKAWSFLGGGLLEHHEVVIRSGPGEFSGVVEQQGRMFNGLHDLVEGRRIAVVVVTTAETT